MDAGSQSQTALDSHLEFSHGIRIDGTQIEEVLLLEDEDPVTTLHTIASFRFTAVVEPIGAIVSVTAPPKSCTEQLRARDPHARRRAPTQRCGVVTGPTLQKVIA